MSGSTLDPDELPLGKPRKTAEGHDTRSLGPSDSSDSGSDMAGPGLIDDDALHLDRGTNEDIEGGDASAADAGTSVGNASLDSDTDKAGTGEHRTVGKEPRARPNADIEPDRVVGATEAGLGTGLDQAEEGRLGITDEEIERELGVAREPFETGDETELRPTPARKAKAAERPRASAARPKKTASRRARKR